MVYLSFYSLYRVVAYFVKHELGLYNYTFLLSQRIISRFLKVQFCKPGHTLQECKMMGLEINSFVYEYYQDAKHFE